MKLTKNDRFILNSYASMLEGLSNYLGSAYEISLHSLEDYNHSVVKIYNGYHSGRTIGAPITDLALNMLKRITDSDIDENSSYTSYFAINKMGEHLKSSTIPIKGDNNRIIGLVCINLYLDSPLTEILQTLTDKGCAQPKNENFAHDMTDTVADAVAEAKNQVMYNPNIQAINRNKALIQILYEKGIFNIKDSVVQVARLLGISKNTVYMHLRNIDCK